LELVTFLADASAYYGPDDALREMLAHAADTWQPVHREAAGNALKPQAQRGTIVQPYPLVIAVDEQQSAHVKVKGGLGHIPITFTGLTSPTGHRLLVNGQTVDQWQTDWNPLTQRWQLTCNAPSVAGGSLEAQLITRK
ncbi:MAG: hypothetical protein ACOYMN_24300, partial [Roseimicrobium sp.]